MSLISTPKNAEIMPLYPFVRIRSTG